ELKRKEREKLEQTEYNSSDYSFGYFAKKYLDNYVFNEVADTELKRRNQAMKKAFITKICSISIEDRHITKEEKERDGIEHVETVYRYFK
ncbi:hypothetical protein ABTL18_19610, partial [Acinetobacter baumannii]